jgi:hypothetical protein
MIEKMPVHSICVLKGTHPQEGEVSHDFTWREKDTAIAIGRIWFKIGWKPRLLVKSWDGRFFWLTSLLGQEQVSVAA